MTKEEICAAIDDDDEYHRTTSDQVWPMIVAFVAVWLEDSHLIGRDIRKDVVAAWVEEMS